MPANVVDAEHEHEDLIPAPPWNVVLRALREARGVTQEGWAAHLGVGRRTVQRWERGEVAPDPSMENAIVAYCRAHGLFIRYEAGPFAGITVTERWLAKLLAQARLSDRRISQTDHRPVTINLPATMNRLVGRERAIAEVVQLMQSERLITLTGPGGVGKTRLAIEAARTACTGVEDRVHFVSLGGLHDPALVSTAIAQAVGVVDAAGKSVIESLIGSLQGRSMLLILDNFEHLLGAAADVMQLLAMCPQLRIVVTSRAALHVSGERIYPVQPLDLPASSGTATAEEDMRAAAVVLFIERAQAATPSFEVVTSDAVAVAEICRWLDGLPLALELAAARTTVLTPQTLLMRLERRLPLLTGGAVDLPERQRTLRDTIRWSHDLLEESESILFRRLAVFASGWTLAAAEAVCSDVDDTNVVVLDGLTSLLDKSLITRDPTSDGELRFTMLATIREFALAELDTHGERYAIQERHAAYYLRLAEESAPHLVSAQREPWLRRLDPEMDNLRAAMAWSLGTEGGRRALRIAGALWWHWRYRGRYDEGRRWLEEALTATADAPPDAARAVALAASGALGWHRRDFATSNTRLDAAIALGRSVGVPHVAGFALCIRSYDLRWEDYPAARALAEEALAIFQSLGDRWGTAYAYHSIASATLTSGDAVIGRPAAESALALFRELGDPWGTAVGLYELESIEFIEGRYAESVAHTEEALALFRAMGDDYMVNNMTADVGRGRWAMGDIHGALAAYEALLAGPVAGGVVRTERHLLVGYATMRLGDQSRALTHFAEAMRLAPTDPTFVMPRALIAAAHVAGVLGEWERAALLLGAVAAHQETMGRMQDWFNEERLTATIAASRVALGESAFARIWENGRTLAIDNALALARATTTVGSPSG
ncbi:MAG: helix-turn-helix domain-containing protein [Dehalococcoidia bacterium]